MGMMRKHQFEVKNPNWIVDYTHRKFGRVYTLDHPIKLKSKSYMKNDTLKIREGVKK